MPNDPEQDALLARLARGDLGPWGAQGFIPGGITVLRPDTGMWESIYYTPGDADLTESIPGEIVDVSGLELDPNYEGTFVSPLGGAIGTPITSGGPGKVFAAVSAANYNQTMFPNTDLGEIRLTIGVSNGATGPLSPIHMGNLQEVDKDGNKWLPVVRMFAEKQQGGGGELVDVGSYWSADRVGGCA